MHGPGVHRILDSGEWSFGLCSENASAVTLQLYAGSDPERPAHAIELAPQSWASDGRRIRLWRATVAHEIVAAARYYAYRVAGPRDSGGGAAERGHRFDRGKLLVDPYAREIFFPPGFSRRAAQAPGDTEGRAPLGVLPAGSPAQRPRPRQRALLPRHPLHRLVVYELHVRGFTRRASSGVASDLRGTYAGLVEKIPYLLDLGVTAVELLPVFQFDPQEGNYWGYMPMSFCAAHRAYAAGDDPAGELAAAVEAFHRAGIEVWLDVVYNHTAEGDETGPTYSHRGIDNAESYLLDPDDPRSYRNDSGTGNVFACARPAPRRLILDSLRYWIEEIGVAGFRFDLATLLARDADGRLERRSELLAQIGALAAETGVRLVAEPWDLAAYRLGEAFPGRGWWQWNGRFRDAVRSFVRGDAGLEREVALRLGGSPDLFGPAGGGADGWGAAGAPVNYVTCHDGFTLWDLVSYDRERSHANGCDHRDGPADARSWNCGWEGDEGVPPEVLALRRRQVRNLICLTLLASGVPMLLAGDEMLHTQGGKDNPYDQDDETTWLDWERLRTGTGFHRFVRELIALRKAHPGLAVPWGSRARWFAPDAPEAAAEDPRAVACHLPARLTGADAELFVAANASPEARSFRLPSAGWRRVVDTGRVTPRDVVALEPAPGHDASMPDPEARMVELSPRSVVVLRRLT